MAESRRHRIPAGLLTFIVVLGVGGILARDAIFFGLIYPGSRADWELRQLRQQIAGGEMQESEEAARATCLELARANPGTRAEAAAYMYVAKQWPETTDAEAASEKLLAAAKTVAIADWAHALEEIRPGDRSPRWRSLAGLLIERVRQLPDDPKAARLLCEAAVAIHPDSSDETAPPELHQIAELIQESYATSPDVANFCEVAGNLGRPVGWSRPFEPHVRHILEVNDDRFVRCSAHFALASIVRAGGIARQDEARQLYEDFLSEFDGETAYPAQPIEQNNRETARRVLETIRLHGLGAPALASVGIDLEGQTMSLADYRGRVVLLSFWATWCAPCMSAISQEKELLEHFGPEQFAIVGVNADTQAAEALQAVARHGITWRSFQDKQVDGSSLARDWHVAGYPTFYLLDAEGVIVQCWQGLPPQSELQETIGELVE